MGGANHGKNGWSSPWQKWVELTVAKMGGTGVRDTVTKMGGAHCGKNVETGNEVDERRRCRKAPKLISLSDCCNRFSSPSLLCASPLLSVLRLANVVWCVVWGGHCGGAFFCFQHQVLIIPDNGISVLNLQTSRIMPHTHSLFFAQSKKVCRWFDILQITCDWICKSQKYFLSRKKPWSFVLLFAVRRIDEKR